jgi:nucleoside-diphosphate kinase
MGIERTLSIIKPNGVKKPIIGNILNRFEAAGLRIAALKLVHLSKAEAERFYEIHKEKPFFDELTTFMCSGPVVVSALEGENAIAKNREIMGATNPKDADPGTIRADFADSLTENTVHGSDAPDTAKVEIAFFFSDTEIVNR